MIIFLNGTSSAGKTSIAREIMRLSTDLFVLYSVDFLLNQWIDRKFITINTEPHEEWQKEWFFHYQTNHNNEWLTVSHSGPKAATLSKDIIEALSLLAHRGRNLIIDEVFMFKEQFSWYVKAFRDIHPIYLVQIQCDPLLCAQREIARKDRWLGCSRGFQVVYEYMPTYDLSLNTTTINPTELAQHILQFISTHPSPTAFKEYNK